MAKKPKRRSLEARALTRLRSKVKPNAKPKGVSEATAKAITEAMELFAPALRRLADS